MPKRKADTKPASEPPYVVGEPSPDTDGLSEEQLVDAVRATNTLPKKGLPPWLVPGNPGNKGGGRPKGKIRRDALNLFDVEARRLFKKILQDPDARQSDKLKALELLAKVAGIDKPEELSDGAVVIPQVIFVTESAPPLVEELDLGNA